MRFKIVLFAICLISFNSEIVNAQKNKGKTESSPSVSQHSGNSDLARQKNVFRQALKYLDFSTAISALYNVVEMQPNAHEYRDTLALLYYNQGAFVQATLLGDEILKEHPGKTDILEMVAISKQSLGMAKESLADYEKLFGTTKNSYHLYQIASLQYALKRFGECENSMRTILASPDIDQQKISMANPDKTNQEVPLRAAVHNMQGVVALDVNNREAAMANFRKAVEIFPDFALAKGNLESLSRLIQSEKDKK